MLHKRREYEPETRLRHHSEYERGEAPCGWYEGKTAIG